MKPLMTPLFAAVLLLASCAKDKISGSGTITTEHRSVSNFTKLTTAGAADVHVLQGANFSVQVKGYSNLLPYFETRVVNNTLAVGYKEGTNVRNDNVEVFVTMPTLEGARIEGSADMDVKGTFTSNRMDFSVDGSGNIDVENGTTQGLYTAISGSGNIRLHGLMADAADVNIAGSGTTEVTVVTYLKATLTGSGNVYYKGTPVVESSVSGTGKIVHRP
ncbi:MAG: DUF2807 domain-containing protein [Bacteroidota bacterium]|nr:DUF2807 domain-containing protein [Bacteroidota bacterium]